MLIEFSVKNFMSFKSKKTFTLLAGAGEENEENLIDNGNEKLLKTAAIYGPNASGKTNFMKALTAAILMIRKSNTRNVSDILIEMKPFIFDKKMSKLPCEFEFIFIKNDIKYIYGFAADKYKIYDEYLYKYLSAKPSLVFSRNENSGYKFPQSEKSKLSELATKNTEKRLFLSTATEWNYIPTREPYMFFSENIDVFSDYNNITGFSFNSFENDKDGKLKEFTINLLKEADIVIKDYNFEVKNIDVPNFAFAINNISIPNENVINKSVKISTMHEIENESGEKENFEFDISEESLGTKNLFFFSPILKDAFERGKVIIIDEIEKSLHPLLVQYIIGLFHNKKININNAQLIFTTHDTNLLSIDIFRRDQIWFTEKDIKRGSTDLYPLDDFSVRKNENIQKGYLMGRYGAIPFLTRGGNLWIK